MGAGGMWIGTVVMEDTRRFLKGQRQDSLAIQLFCSWVDTQRHSSCHLQGQLQGQRSRGVHLCPRETLVPRGKKLWSHTVEYYSALEGKETCPFQRRR